MKLSLGFSPCPNDTFIFDALVNKKIETAGFEFEVVLEDVQSLNQWAAEGKLDITKLSFPALFMNTESYALLDAGAALGKGVGPLLVAKNTIDPSHLEKQLIAIPGKDTTANLLLGFAFPSATNKVSMLFSDIEEAVLNEEVDLGVIIHENRFTYQEKGLIRICDLGEIWEEKQKLPIPLGCIAIKKMISSETRKKVDSLIRQSIEFAMKNYPSIPPFVSQHAQEMDEAVMQKHIELYVNDFSLQLGTGGKAAIESLYENWRRITGTNSNAAL